MLDRELDISPEVGGHRSWLRLHAWVLIGMATIVVTGTCFSFWWNSLTHHTSSWYQPPDLWLTFRTSQYVAWGFEGEIYKAQTFFDTFPGIAVLLSPIAKLSGFLHLSESFPMFLRKPTAWLILDPANLLLGGMLLFPLDLLARRLLMRPRRRVVLLWLEVVLIWPTVVIWGHPEYAVAVTFGIYGLMAVREEEWVRGGIFLGLAVLFQPLIILMIPIAFSCVQKRRWIPFSLEIAFPSAMLLLAPLVKEWSATTYVILKQPNYPTVDHAMPLASWAPVLQRSQTGVATIVSSGPGRYLAIALACAIGFWVARTKPSLPLLVWWVAVALSLRCVFESVMNPYYLMPGLALLLVASSTLRISRMFVSVIATMSTAVWSYRFLSPWHYFLEIMGLLAVALVSGWPRNHRIKSPVALSQGSAKMLDTQSRTTDSEENLNL